MTKRTVELTFYIELEYDENSKEFKQSLEDYRAAIDKDADADDLIKNCAYQVQRLGASRLLEGIGYVKLNGNIEDETMYCGIEIDNDDPSPQIDFY